MMNTPTKIVLSYCDLALHYRNTAHRLLMLKMSLKPNQKLYIRPTLYRQSQLKVVKSLKVDIPNN